MYLLLSFLLLSLVAPWTLAQTQFSAQLVATSSSLSIQASPVRDTGNPDRPVTTGRLYNGSGEADENNSIERTAPGSETTGSEREDIGAPSGDANTNTTPPPGSQGAPSQVKVILLAPTVDEGSNIHDPGITIVEQLASIGIDDEFGFIANGRPYVRAGYLKMGDIKGESTDEAGKGNVEITWKVEESGKARKPKEIVVVGSKTTDKASPKIFKALCSGLHEACQAQVAVTPESLEDFAQRTVNSYQSVNEIRMDDESVEMAGQQPFKLFGFISMNITHTVSVSLNTDDFGRVKVKFPWYHVLGRKTVQLDDLMTSLEEGVNAMQISKWEVAELDGSKNGTADRPTENITFNFSEVKAQLLQAMSNTLIQYNETDLNFINR